MKKKPDEWVEMGIVLTQCKFKILKAYLILSLAFMFHVSASVSSQVLKIDLNIVDTELRFVIDAIEDQCDYVFFFNEDVIDLSQKLNVRLRNADVDEVINKVFGKKYDFRITGRLIVVSNKDKTIEEANIGFENQKMVSGNVSDSNGMPLLGVNIIIVGSTKGVVSDFDGNYTIQANKGDVLEFSYIGMKTLQFIVSDSDIIDVVLEETEAMDEIVIIGYGTQLKTDVTGSIASVTSDDFEKQPMINATDALQGRAAGVFVGTTNGAPGGDSKILIRGANSITGSSDPLIVVDGILGGRLEDINPEDIASLEVLKDASSTAIFGSRGANGVILITTKNGTSDAPKFTFNTFYSIDNVRKKFNLLSAVDFAREVNASSLAVGGTGNTYSAQEISDLEISGGTDWQDVLFQTGSTQNYQLSVSGKSDKMDYYVSGNIAESKGIIINTNYKRYNVRTKLNADISDKIKVGINLSVTSTEGKNNQDREGFGSPVYGALIFDPTTPIFASDGSYNLTSIKGVASLGLNPFAQQVEFNLDRQGTLSTFNAFINYEIVKGFTLNLTGGSRINLTSDKRFNSELTTPSTASIVNGDLRLNQATSRLTYEKAINNHRFKIDAIFELQSTKWNSNGILGIDITSPSTTFNNIGTANNVVVNSFASESQIESFIGRVNYSFKNKYIITGAIRRDGSSILADGNKYDVFPSVAGAWRISEENFLKDSDIIDNMKIRASYGITGNQTLQPYSSFATLATGPTENYPFNDATAVIGAGPNQIANPNLGWEKTAQFDIGLDVSLLNNRLGFVFDYYKKETSDILLNVPFPDYIGDIQFFANVGDVENIGYEFGINGTIIDTEDFKWDASFNIAFNTTTVTDLGDNEVFFGGTFGDGQAIAPGTILQVGEKMSNFYGFIYEGVWKSNEATEAAVFGNVPGDSKYKDVNNDGVINNDDLTVMGNGQADYIFGFNNSFSYKNFDLNIFFQGVQGNEIWNLGGAFLFGGLGDARHATTSNILNRWTPQNENTNIPGYSQTNFNTTQSSRFVEDGSFIRMKNISLGYTLPEYVLDKFKLFHSLRVYVSGQNLLTITDYSGFDPETTSTGNSSIDQSIDNGAYPTAKTFTFGLNVTF